MKRLSGFLTALVLTWPAGADAAVCTYLPAPPRLSKAERYLRYAIDSRKDYGFRHDRAYVRRVNADPRARARSWGEGSFPMTRREAAYVLARHRLEITRAMGRYLERHRSVFAWTAIIDDWPRDPYLRFGVTRDLDRHRAALRRFGVPFRIRRARWSQGDLDRIQEGIDEDALAAQGIHVISHGQTVQRIEMAVATERTDAQEVVTRLYGPAIRVEVAGPTRTFLECERPASYEVSPDGRTLTVHVGHSGSTTPRHVEVVETAYGVDLGVVVERGYVGRLDLRYSALTVTLAEPIGDRPVRSIEYGYRVKRGRPGRFG